jgi:Domain of unknown function (DUF4845)
VSDARQRFNQGEANMRKNQLGVGLAGLLVGGVLFIVLAMLGLKLSPSYIEFFAVKKAINALGDEARNGANAAAIRKGFDNRATIDAIESVKGSDLEISKGESGMVVSVGYRKEIPLVANIGIYIDFSAVSRE